MEFKQFTGQGVEKSNDDIKMIYHRKTNKHCATAEAYTVFIQFDICKCVGNACNSFLKSDPVRLVHSRFFKQSPRPSLTLFSQMENETPQFVMHVTNSFTHSI
jgi:hypothetical protein